MTTWLIVGANRGIGLALCRQAKARGDDDPRATAIAILERTAASYRTFVHAN